MSDFVLPSAAPPVPVSDDRLKSRKQLVEFANDLQDTEAEQVGKVIFRASQKWSTRRATVQNLEQMRDEILNDLAKIGILATVDVAPILSGEPPCVEILGHISGTEKATYGMDYERKKWEIDKAHDRGEFFLGEKEKPDSTPAQKRDRAENEKRLKKG